MNTGASVTDQSPAGLSSFVISDGSVGDLATLSRLIQTSGAYQGPYLAQVQDRQLEPSYLDDALVRVVREAQGEIVAFASIAVPGRGGPGEGELDWMIVRDDHQGQGLGRALLDDAVTLARLSGLRALVIVAHPPASDFYRRCGAQLTGILQPQGKATWQRDVFRLSV